MKLTIAALNPRYSTLAAAFATSLATASPGSAAVLFDFNYLDATNEGFNATGELGESRRGALEEAGRRLAKYFEPYDATIVVNVKGNEAGEDLLASAGSESNAFIIPGFDNRGDVQLKILGGNAADPDPTMHDAEVDWNFNEPWHLADDVPGDEFDFISTAMHELSHAIGFADGLNRDGIDLDNNQDFENGGYWTPYDRWVGDRDGPVIDPVTYALDAARWAAAREGGTGEGGLFFHGPNAMAANGGNPVNLYSPDEYDDGSSTSHLDDDFFTNAVLMMESTSDFGPDGREYSPVELGILKDIGYTRVGERAPSPAPDDTFCVVVPARNGKLFPLCL